MTNIPDQRADATPGSIPETVEDPIAAAETIANDPSKQGSAEWLAAMQLIADHGGHGEKKARFEELEREMQALRGMSEI